MIGAVPVLNIEGEIGYQRALIARMGEILENNGLAAGSSQGLTEDTRNTLKLLNQTMEKLLSYVRVHNMLKGDLTEYREEIERGKMLGRERRHVFDYFQPPQSSAAPDDREPPAPRRKQAGSAKAARKTKPLEPSSPGKADGHD